MIKIIYLKLFFLFTFTLFAQDARQSATVPDGVKQVLKNIESKMSKIKSLECEFVQKKKLAIFTKEILITGKIFIQSPDLFAWHGNKPVLYSIVVNKNIFKQWDEDTDKVITFDLNSKPAFKTILKQMQSWFSGNYLGLADEFRIEVTENKPLKLTFIPRKDATSEKMIKSVVVLFKKDLRYIENINITEKDGDSTNITFKNVKLNKDIPAKAWIPKQDV